MLDIISSVETKIEHNNYLHIVTSTGDVGPGVGQVCVQLGVEGLVGRAGELGLLVQQGEDADRTGEDQLQGVAVVNLLA